MSAEPGTPRYAKQTSSAFCTPEQVPSRQVQGWQRDAMTVHAHPRARALLLLSEAFRHEKQRLASLLRGAIISKDLHDKLLHDIRESYVTLSHEADSLLRGAAGSPHSPESAANSVFSSLSGMFVWADSILCNNAFFLKRLQLQPHPLHCAKREIAVGRSTCTLLLSFASACAAGRHKAEELLARRRKALMTAIASRSIQLQDSGSGGVPSPQDLSDEEEELDLETECGAIHNGRFPSSSDADDDEGDTVVLSQAAAEEALEPIITFSSTTTTTTIFSSDHFY